MSRQPPSGSSRLGTAWMFVLALVVGTALELGYMPLSMGTSAGKGLAITGLDGSEARTKRINSPGLPQRHPGGQKKPNPRSTKVAEVAISVATGERWEPATAVAPAVCSAAVQRTGAALNDAVEKTMSGGKRGFVVKGNPYNMTLLAGANTLG